MSNTTEMILHFFKEFGWQLTVLATSGIVFLGLLKAFGVFKKIKSSYKKYIYYALSTVLSILACTAYIFITDVFEWRTYLILIAGIIGYTSAIYTLYENTGIRDLLKKFLYEPIKKLLTKIWNAILQGTLKKETVIKMASDMGVDVANQIIHTAIEKEAEKKVEAEKKEAEKLEKEKAKEEKAETKPEILEESKEEEKKSSVRVIKFSKGQ